MKERLPYCIHIEKPSLFYDHFAFVDTKDGMGIELLLQNRVRIRSGEVYSNETDKYQLIFCKVKKADSELFLEVIGSLPNKVLICGGNDYLDYCNDLCKELGVPNYQERDREKSEVKHH